MNGIFRAVVAAALLFTESGFASPRVAGEITALNFTYDFGSAPGADRFDALGTYVLGSGSNGLNLPSDAVVLSFHGGSFIQAIPSNSFTAISGGWRYLSTSPGISEIRILNSGAVTIRVRLSDFTGIDPISFGPLSLSVGDDVLTAVPNSIPVAKIVGSSTVQVGAVASFDYSSSTDFNGTAGMLFNWSIVSQPLGSNVSLSSTSNPTSSLIASTNGDYVVRCSVNDGVADGVPSLITVTASGGTEDPPPAPGPDNGLIVLSTNQSTPYLVGESAVLTLHESVQPGNGNRWFFRATLNDVPITLVPVPSTTDNTYTTPVFEVAGNQVFRAEAFVENASLATKLASTLLFYQKDVLAVDAALLHEQDVSEISRLLAQKAYDMEQISVVEAQIEENREAAGEAAILNFTVAE